MLFGLRHIGAGSALTQKLALVQNPQAQSFADLIAHFPKCPKLCLCIANHCNWISIAPLNTLRIARQGWATLMCAIAEGNHIVERLT